jgi:hypothetical protein
VILATGDSHSLFWRGQDTVEACEPSLSGLDVLHLGAATAYQMVREDSPRAEKLRRGLNARKGQISLLITCFGEIDCRTHVVKQAQIQSRTVEAVAGEVADRYLSFVSTLSTDYGLPVAMWGPPPSMSPQRQRNNHTYPTVGTMYERNRATAALNAALHDGATRHARLAFFTLFDELVDAEGATSPDALFDGAHLSAIFLPRALEKLDPVLEQFGISAMRPVFVSE